MITEDSILNMPLLNVLEGHAQSIVTCGTFLRSVPGDWMEEAIYMAKQEIVSDYELEILNAKEVIKEARKQLTFKRKVKNVFKSIGIIINGH